jgi:hypothetical protein
MYEPIIEGILGNLCHPFISKKDFNFLGQLYELSSKNTSNWQNLTFRIQTIFWVLPTGSASKNTLMV